MVDRKDVHTMKRERSQVEMILEALQSGARLTHLDAISRFGCARLAARIADIRALGHDVKTRMIATTNGAHIAEYWIEPPQDPQGRLNL